MSTKFLDFYRREWLRVAAVQAMVLGGVSVLAGRKTQTNPRPLAVMNAMTPGQVNIGLFKSDQPLNYPFNADSAMRQHFLQAVAHGLLMPRLLHTKYSPGALPAALLHLPIGITYLTALRAQGPIGRGNWIKTGAIESTSPTSEGSTK